MIETSVWLTAPLRSAVYYWSVEKIIKSSNHKETPARYLFGPFSPLKKKKNNILIISNLSVLFYIIYVIYIIFISYTVGKEWEKLN